METLSGLVARFDREMIFHQDLALLDRVRTDLIELTLKHRNLNLFELFIDGYNDDPRALYDVPEVNRWMRLALARWPDLLFWLAPESLRLVLLCLNPGMHKSRPDHTVEVKMYVEELIPQIGKSQVAALEVLQKGGLPQETKKALRDKGTEIFLKFAEQKKSGTDYLLVYPDTRAMRILARPEKEE